MAGRLEGIKVVELGVWVAGAGGWRQPRRLGCRRRQNRAADRRPGPSVPDRMMGLDMDTSPPFEMDNRSKRSVVLDLSTDHDRTAALELISGRRGIRHECPPRRVAVG